MSPPPRERLHGLLRHHSRNALATRRDLLQRLSETLLRTERATDGLDARIRAVEAGAMGLEGRARRLDGPFEAGQTVEEAWRRHPGARRVFASRSLPDCDGCAVRFDETLAEVAQAYAIDLDALLADLNALLPGSRARGS